MIGATTSYARVIRAMRRLENGTATLNRFGFLQAVRQPLFRSGETTRCTCCGASQWIVGRQSAECGVCGSPAGLATPATITHLTAKPKG